jgi:translation initiation factor 2 beta subunit (eIF-2beta)/eIF-5
METVSNTRKYSSSVRRNIVQKISKLKDKKDFVKIYNIIQTEIGKDLSINRNGIFFNINLLSDECIDNLNNYLNELNECTTATETDTKIKYQAYNTDEVENINKLGPKLSNQEKSILKKIQKF